MTISQNMFVALMQNIIGNAKSFGTYEEFSEATDELKSASDELYENVGKLYKETFGVEPSKNLLTSILEEHIGEKGLFDD